MFGKRLRQLRKENKLTQRDLAKLLNVSDRTIGYYESSERTPGPDAIVKLSNFFNVSTDYLLGKSKYRQLSLDSIKDVKEIINRIINYLENAVNTMISALKVGLEMANKKINRLF